MTESRFRLRAGSLSADLGATEVVIGRSVYCTVVIDHPSVSRVHASLKRVDDHCELLDMGSRNGTFVNGSRLNKVAVRVNPGDSIELGDISMTLEQIPGKVTGTLETGCSHPLFTPEEETTGMVRRPDGRVRSG